MCVLSTHVCVRNPSLHRDAVGLGMTCFVCHGNVPELILLSTTGMSGNVSPRSCPGSRLYARRQRFPSFLQRFSEILKLDEKRVETCVAARTEVVLSILGSVHRAVSSRAVRGRRAENFSVDGCGCSEQTDRAVSPGPARAAYGHLGDHRPRTRRGGSWLDLDPRRCSPGAEFEFPCPCCSRLTPFSAPQTPQLTTESQQPCLERVCCLGET